MVGQMTQPLASILAKLRELKPMLAREFGVASISVFGSYARGEQTESSDLDLLVDFLPGARPTFFSLSKLEGRLSAALDLKVETVPRDGLNARLEPYIRPDLVDA